MLNNADARRAAARVVDPVARGLLRIGVTPDLVTVVGAGATSAAALVWFPRGEFLIALAVMVLLTMSDLLDGTMARMRGTAGPWGNFLDSTLDRVTDGAVFGGLLWWAVVNGETVAAWAALVCLVGGFTISYAKARAESVGATANVGIAERAERLIVAYLAALLTGLGLAWAMPVLLSILAVLVVITVGQRFVEVRRQLAVPPAGAS
jgi:CDP-diacylglycerol--glycerol-3-phosphate 3-phosphatidyltransferase